MFHQMQKITTKSQLRGRTMQEAILAPGPQLHKSKDQKQQLREQRKRKLKQQENEMTTQGKENRLTEMKHRSRGSVSKRMLSKLKLSIVWNLLNSNNDSALSAAREKNTLPGTHPRSQLTLMYNVNDEKCNVM